MRCSGGDRSKGRDGLGEAHKLFRGLVSPPLISRVHHVDDTVCVLVVILPVGADVLLAADVPHIQLEARLLHRLDVEALRRRDLTDILLRSAAPMR